MVSHTRCVTAGIQPVCRSLQICHRGRVLATLVRLHGLWVRNSSRHAERIVRTVWADRAGVQAGAIPFKTAFPATTTRREDVSLLMSYLPLTLSHQKCGPPLTGGSISGCTSSGEARTARNDSVFRYQFCRRDDSRSRSRTNETLLPVSDLDRSLRHTFEPSETLLMRSCTNRYR